MSKELGGEIRILGDKEGGYVITFSLRNQGTLASYEMSAEAADCDKEVKQLVSKIMGYKPS